MLPAIRRVRQEWVLCNIQQYIGVHRSSKLCTRSKISLTVAYVDKSQRDLDKLFNDYNIQESIDTLHKVVNDAKERKLRGEDGKDAWKDNLDPKVAVCARTVPLLNSEAKRLRKLIAEVYFSL